jgi:hypothetical protein
MMIYANRYFVLNEGTLKYWKNKEERDEHHDSPLGSIDCMDAEITIVKNREQQGFIWFLAQGTNGDIFEFANETKADRQSWLTVLFVSAFGMCLRLGSMCVQCLCMCEWFV